MRYSGHSTIFVTISVWFIPHLMGLACAACSSQDTRARASSAPYCNTGATWMTLSALERVVKGVGWQGFALT